MTRQETKDIAVAISFEHDGKQRVAVDGVHELINQIYDDHEAELEALQSRSCEGCEHWHRVNDFNVSNPCYQWAKDVMTKKHFCCNLWEAKQ